MNIWIINGPNLNLTGKRETEIYGHTSFETFLTSLQTKYTGVDLHYYQSNIEGELITAIHQADGPDSAIILNAGGYTHTSVGISDAVRAVSCPVIEVHMTNVFRREDFRHRSLIAPFTKGIIIGFGLDSYLLALESLVGR